MIQCSFLKKKMEQVSISTYTSNNIHSSKVKWTIKMSSHSNPIKEQ